MTLNPADTLEETPATRTETLSERPALLALDDSPPLSLNRDSIQLLLQSPGKLFLYWSFATDPNATLRAAFGELAAQYRLAVRLVKVESGEEFVLDAARERMQWFEVYPRHVYRADVGFHAANRPFVRLLSSKEVSTPPDRASHVSAEEQEFQVQAQDFVRQLNAAGYERYARGLAQEAGVSSRQDGDDEAIGASATRPAAAHAPGEETADEYPHR